ncbi:SLIT and NTRK-like protein 2 [Arapaima gigas]
MLNGVLLLGVLTAIGLISKTETRKTSKDLCKNRCFCEERENLLNINCENKGFTTASQYQPPPNKICQLFLNGNFLTKLNPNEFVNYINVTSLHLGNNGLQEIKTGAFNGLKYLKRLHLNNNNLEIIKEETFAGLENLEYLQADYNYICAIEPGAFSKLNKLKVLILNDNLLPSLPNNVFRFMLLTHLDLRGNRFKSLPFAGVLEHIGGIMEIQLEENPWNCTCDLVPLKAWLDTISVFVGDIVCETPFRLHGKDVTQLIRQDFCPRKNAVDSNQRVMKPPSDSQYQNTFPTLYPGVTQTKPPRASRPPKMRNRSTTRVTASSKDVHVFGPIMVYQTRLYLNGNYIENLTPFLFEGLQSLQYLYLEYNIIKDIAPQTFNSLHNLQLLFLNNNLLRSLPDDVFGGTMLTRLNLRNNHFSHLPVRGVLDQLSPFIQIDLLENPWDCTCDIVALKNWMEMSSTSVVVNEITCDSPSKQAGRLLRSLRNDEVCPEANSVMGTRMPKVSTSSLGAYTISVTTEIMSEMDPEVPLSVLILGLLIVFILSVCFGAGLFVLVLKKRKAVENLPSNPNTFDLNALQVPYSSYNAETRIDKPDSHMYNYIHTPASQMCQNPIYLQKESDQLAYYRNLKEMNFSTLDHKKDKRTRSPAYTISMAGFNNKEPGGRGDSELLYQNIVERDNELPSTGDLKYNFSALPKALAVPTYEPNRHHVHNQDQLHKHKLPRKSTVQTNNQHHRHPWKHKTVPDYLEVLEKYTTTSHL